MIETIGRSGRDAAFHVGAAAKAVLLGLAMMLTLPAAPAEAQDLRAQVQRLQKELKTLQGYVYGGQAQTGGSATSAGGTDLGRPIAARLELRISQLENQMRGLTGQIEQVGFQINQLSRKLDGLTNDVYARLQRLEQQAVVPGVGLASPADLQQQTGEAPGQAPEQPAIASLSTGTSQAPAGGTGQLASGESGSQVIGSVSASSLEALRQQAAGQQTGGSQQQNQQLQLQQPQTTQTASTGQFATAKEQYDHAFGLLSQANYPAAEQALGAFLVAHPQDPLAGNAKYWLGETQYVRGQYREAAVTFAEGFQQYPNSGKAPDNLLKLAKSLAALGQTPDSCGTLGELLRRYPKAPANVLQQAQRERQRLSCQ